MGLAVANIGYGFYWEDTRYAAAFVLGAIAMRGAGCTYNDILDKEIDAKVERTRLRPLPSGAVTTKAAWAWLLAQCAAGLIALLMLPPLAQIVSLIAIPLVALYPLMKRITWWPQAWLGIVFSWGALVGAAASTYETGIVPQEAFALYAGCIMWTIAYDTIYALQDREDDALVGVRSTARLFADKWRTWTSVFYILALAFWAAAGAMSGAGLWVAAGIGAACGFGLYTIATYVTFLTLFLFEAMWYIEEHFIKTAQTDVEKEFVLSAKKHINHDEGEG
jgi:4-hydroxybenzoate polyprenyltransferase